MRSVAAWSHVSVPLQYEVMHTHAYLLLNSTLDCYGESNIGKWAPTVDESQLQFYWMTIQGTHCPTMESSFPAISLEREYYELLVSPNTQSFMGHVYIQIKSSVDFSDEGVAPQWCAYKRIQMLHDQLIITYCTWFIRYVRTILCLHFQFITKSYLYTLILWMA